MRFNMVPALFVILVVHLSACGSEQSQATAPTPAAPASVLSEVPNPVDRTADYLIYLHGAIIESQGMNAESPKFGRYEYAAILQAFADRGFTVISEARPARTRPDVYAQRVVEQVRKLLDGGVPETQITVVGFSKGGVIALLASRDVARPGVNWVIQAGCGPWIDKAPDLIPTGRVLSQVDGSDTIAGSCADLFSRMPKDSDTSEQILDVGRGHGTFYRVDPRWFESAVHWGGR